MLQLAPRREPAERALEVTTSGAFTHTKSGRDLAKGQILEHAQGNDELMSLWQAVHFVREPLFHLVSAD